MVTMMTSRVTRFVVLTAHISLKFLYGNGVVNGLSLPLLSIPNGLDTFTSGLASIARLPRGVSVAPNIRKNETVLLEQFKNVENRCVLFHPLMMCGVVGLIVDF